MSHPTEDGGMVQDTEVRTRRSRAEPLASVPPSGSPSAERAERDALAVSVVRSKVQPPPLRASTLERTRLLSWLEARSTDRVILVSAEAGYGKTTLLADFARRVPAQCVWYRLDPSDRDWLTFITYLVAAVKELHPDFGASTLALLRQLPVVGPSMQVVLDTFIAEFEAVGDVPCVFILDDFHLVADADDVRRIMGRLFERAPSQTRFLVAARSRPDIPLGRLAARGELAELASADLRFTHEEVEALFSTSYGQSLDPEVYQIIEERTEGWAASLQLVSTSIATRAPDEVRDFIRDLSGAEGPIYEFLAEEVLAHLPALTRRVLLFASLLEQVETTLVAAAFAATDEPVPPDAIVTAIQEVEDLGLISRRTSGSKARRLHPLLKSFLERELERELKHQGAVVDLATVHGAIARAAEESGLWVVAVHHYLAGNYTHEAARLLADSVGRALGTGDWGHAACLAKAIPLVESPPALLVVRARALIESGDANDAIHLLRALAADQLSDLDRSLVRMTRAAALHHVAAAKLLFDEVLSIADDTSTPQSIRAVAQAWLAMLKANRGQSIARAGQALMTLATSQRASGLHYYAGIALHNAANAELAHGNPARAHALAAEAITELRRAGASNSVEPSSLMIEASALAEMGRVDDALTLADRVARMPDARADALAEAAWLNAVCGHPGTAQALLARVERLESEGHHELGSRALQAFARLALAHTSTPGEPMGSKLRLTSPDESQEVDVVSRWSFIRALFAILDGDANGESLARQALKAATMQEAWRWASRARLLLAIAQRSRAAILTWLTDSTGSAFLTSLELADAIGTVLDQLVPAPPELERSITSAPQRWLPILRRCVTAGSSPPAMAAAVLLARFGTIEDAPLLAAFERRAPRSRRSRRLWPALTKRVSPTVRLHDLGRTCYEVGERTVQLTDTRRKAAALLLFLVTRPGQAATREQVMEALWPDQNPSAAVNSLHQTLYFLRRDIEPFYEDGVSADYVPMDSELVYLEPDLVHVDSISFHRQASETIVSTNLAQRGLDILRLYSGRFAPEFEYEMWTEDWREGLHSLYLDLAQETATRLIESARFREAVGILKSAVALDAAAFGLEALLVKSLGGLGATDAAAAQYRHFAAAYQREFGQPAPLFNEVLEGKRYDRGGFA
jgi:LuxR family transcriptional regulator, maltose regulon positive regulatory protein